MSSGAGGGFDMERTLVRPARSEWKGSGAGGGWLLGEEGEGRIWGILLELEWEDWTTEGPRKGLSDTER